MANNVQFQSSSPSTPSSATIVESVDQGGGVQRQKISVADIFGSSTIITTTPSSNANVVIFGTPTIAFSTGATTIINGANTANVVAGSSSVTSTMSALVVALSTLGNAGLSVYDGGSCGGDFS